MTGVSQNREKLATYSRIGLLDLTFLKSDVPKLMVNCSHLFGFNILKLSKGGSENVDNHPIRR